MAKDIFNAQQHIKMTETSFYQGFNRTFKFNKASSENILRKNVSNMAHWSSIQKSKYLLFICYFRDSFTLETQYELNWNLFKCMATFIQTRSAQQCRSQHIKLLKKFKTVQDYIFKASNKFSTLRQKIYQVEDKLEELRQKFNLFPLKLQKNFNNSFIDNSEYNQDDGRMMTIQNPKQDKLGLIKTSDQYIETNNMNIKVERNYLYNGKKQMPSFHEDLSNLTEQNAETRVIINDIYQFQYLYQLWSNKLEQIIINTAKYQMKN